VLQQSVVTRSLLGGLAVAVPLSVVVGAVLQLAWAPELSMAASFPYAVLGGLMAVAVGGVLGGAAGALWGWLIATIVDAVVSTVIQDKLEPWLSLGRVACRRRRRLGRGTCRARVVRRRHVARGAGSRGVGGAARQR
jgi:hypothetical protein